MAAYTLAFTEPVQMNMIHKSKTPDYPKGLTNLVMKQIIKQYCPVDQISAIEAKNSIEKCEDVGFRYP